jgi:hypothetical protein
MQEGSTIMQFETYETRTVPQGQLIDWARVIAMSHNLPVELVCAVCEEESGKRNARIPGGLEDWDPTSTRFEVGFLRRWVKPDNLNAPTTEEIDSAHSFGLMQIMGLTARELGFKGRYLTELCNPECGLEFGCRKLRVCMDRTNNKIEDALLQYNGGSDPGYPSRVMGRMSKYRR